MTSLFRESVITLFTRMAAFAFYLGTSVLVARLIGPTLTGAYTLFLVSLEIAALMVLCGLGAANVFHGAKDRKLLPSLVGNSVLASAGFGLVSVVLTRMLVSVPSLSQYYADNVIDVDLLSEFVYLIPLLLLQRYLIEVVRAAGDILAYNLLNLWRAIAGLIMLVALVVIYDESLETALSAWALATIVTLIPILFYAVRAAYWKVSFDLSLLWNCLGFGMRLHLGNVAQFMNYKLDIFLVGYFLGPFQIGIYSIATALAERVWEIPHAIRTGLLYRISSQSEAHIAAQITSQVTRTIAILMAAVCILLSFVSYPLVMVLYGERFISVVLPLILLMPGVWALSIGKILSVHLSGIGKPELATYGALLSLVATIGLDILLIPTMGTSGAAVASSIAYAISTAFYLACFKYITGNTISSVLIPSRDELAMILRNFNSASFGLLTGSRSKVGDK
jgi:O-antigen/teichoic acid export membrane protein